MPLRDENRILVRRGLAALNRKPRAGPLGAPAEGQPPGQEARRRRHRLAGHPRRQRRGPHGRGRQGGLPLPRRDRGPSARPSPTRSSQMNVERRRLGGETWDARLPRGPREPRRARRQARPRRLQEVFRGITGLIASKMTGILKVPAIVASFQEDGTVVGSIRSARGFPISSFLEACADLFIDYGGHDAAAGFSLQMKDWPEFEARTIAYCRGPGARGRARRASRSTPSCRTTTSSPTSPPSPSASSPSAKPTSPSSSWPETCP